MAHSINHLEEKIEVSKLIQKALESIELPEGYVISNAQATIMFKPQKLITALVYLNPNPKGGFDVALDLQ